MKNNCNFYYRSSLIEWIKTWNHSVVEATSFDIHNLSILNFLIKDLYEYLYFEEKRKSILSYFTIGTKQLNGEFFFSIYLFNGIGRFNFEWPKMIAKIIRYWLFQILFLDIMQTKSITKWYCNIWCKCVSFL